MSVTGRALRICAWRAAAALALVPLAAVASDGAIEINQTRALAGGVTAGDAPGFPVTLSASGAYRLTGDLDVRGEATPGDVTAIEISADDVTLDLGGYAIRGPVVCTGGGSLLSCPGTGSGRGVGIASAATPTNTWVRHGRIIGMGSLAVQVLDGARLEDLSVVSCGGGLSCGNGCLVAESAVRIVDGDAIAVGAAARVLNNRVGANKGAGVSGSSAAASLVLGNEIEANGGAEINLTGAAAVLENVVSRIAGTTLSLSSDAGYGRNQIEGTVSGGVNLGRNACSGADCP